MAAAQDERALAGVRVLDLTASMAGAVAGMLLADLGADVVKVYPPDPGPLAAQPARAMWDRGKRVVSADPDRADDLLALDQLLAGADVLLVGTTGPGVTYDRLTGRGHRPGEPCPWVALPPYLLGETPWAGEAESAGLLSAWLGQAWNQSSYADVPVDCLFPLPLYMQGIWAAIVAVALLAGRRRGLTVAPLAVAGGAHGTELVSPGGFTAERDEPHVHRPGGPGGTLPNYRTYRCADGEWLFLAAFTNAFVERGLTAAGAGWIFDDPRVAGNTNNVRLPGNVTWIAAALDQLFATRPRQEWLDLLEAADCPAAPVHAPGRWLEHEQVRALGLRLEAVSDAGQPVVMPGPLVGLSLTPASPGGPAPSSWPAITAARPRWTEAGPPADRPPAVASAPAPSSSSSSSALSSSALSSSAPSSPAPQPPLSGLRVLDLGTIIAGPYVGSLLADLGADVIKVERPPRGDEFRVAHGGRGGSSFEVYNRDQRSALIDLSTGDGRRLFDQLAATADVVVDNYRAGVAARLGLAHDQLAAASPGIVTVSISAFGETGPLGRRPGFDPVIQAMSGIMRAQGGPDLADSPVFLTVPINDVLAAGLAALGACAALLARTRLGRGQHVSVTLCAASCLLQSQFLVQSGAASGAGAASGDNSVYPAGGRDFTGPGPLDRLYPAADGWVRLAAEPGQLPALVQAGLAPAPGPARPSRPDRPAPDRPAPDRPAPDLPAPDRPAPDLPAPDLPAPDRPAPDLPAPDRPDPELAGAIAARLAGLPVATVLARAHAAGVPAVRARQARELTADAQLIDHGLLTVLERDDRGATQVWPGRWLESPGLPARVPRPAPGLGEHTEQLRHEAGPNDD